MPADEVEALWSEFMEGTRLVDNVSNREVMDLCSDHTGIHLELFDGSAYEREPFSWGIEVIEDLRWNTVGLVVVTDDPDLNPSGEPLRGLFERDNGVFLTTLTAAHEIIAEGGVVLFFESPDCD